MAKLIRVAQSGTNGMVEAPTYLVGKTNFDIETDVDDGSVLMVVNETTHKVETYHVALNGYWNEL